MNNTLTQFYESQRRVTVSTPFNTLQIGWVSLTGWVSVEMESVGEWCPQLLPLFRLALF